MTSTLHIIFVQSISMRMADLLFAIFSPNSIVRQVIVIGSVITAFHFAICVINTI